MRTLQRLLIPALDICSEVGLYLRLTGSATLDVASRHVLLRTGGEVSTDTYFGVVSVGLWRDRTSVERISLRLDATGSFDVDAVVLGGNGRRVVVATAQLDDDRSTLDLPPLATLPSGLLSFRIRCTSTQGRLRAAEVVTADDARRPVHLGVAITTFNRMPHVAANVVRLSTMFKELVQLAESVEVIIVDNGSNLELPIPGSAPIEIIANPNLGGAGGFARGLFEHRRRGRATHVLFMDDDVVFEPEVIARTVELLRFATDDDLCVAGAMLRTDQPAVQFEAGADCDPTVPHLWQARGRGRNLLYPEVLLESEQQTPFDYGAWWFFAFPLGVTEAYPPPLFVRGDDVYWGLRHMAGRSVTVNGIGVWHADFDPKNGPPSAFYESRNLPIITALAFPDFTAGELRQRVTSVAVRSILSFRYDWAAATLDGTAAFLDGPHALMAADPARTHHDVRSRYGTEVLRALTTEEMEMPELRRSSLPMATLMRLIGVATIGGNLLPGALRRRPVGVLYVQHRSVTASTFRDELLFRFDATAEGFRAPRDRRRALRLLLRTWRLARRIDREFDAAAAAYRRAEPEMTSERFWRAKFVDPAAA